MILLKLKQIKYLKQQMADNFLFFLKNFYLLFCEIASVSTSHSSVVINLAAFLNSHLQLTTFLENPTSQHLIFKHSHLHFSLFYFCLLLQTFPSDKQSHLQLL